MAYGPFKELNIAEVGCDPFTIIDKQWMLVCAGNESSFNMMTASWGELGTLWNRPVATCFIRPQRYTKEFVDAADDFTLSFFSPQYKQALEICGTKSGRDIDKAVEAGLTPFQAGNSIAFEEAQLILVCHKIYAQEMRAECFIDDEVREECYPKEDYHTLYIGSVEKILGSTLPDRPDAH